MWFHILSVAVLIAVGPCMGSYSGLFSLRDAEQQCSKDNCTCDCPEKLCSPCVMPIPPECLTGCGAPSCPCPEPKNNTIIEKKIARAISTVNVHPNGPICSAINIAPDMVMTVSNCILGKPLNDLYVTVNSKPTVDALKVDEVICHPEADNETSICILVTEKSKKTWPFYKPAVQIPPQNKNLEYHKWEVLENGYFYKPTRTPAPSFKECKIRGKPRICLDTTDAVKMGWNDIGTPFVEVVKHSLVPHGLYYGENLFKKDKSIVYLPINKYAVFLQETIERYSQ